MNTSYSLVGHEHMIEYREILCNGKLFLLSSSLVKKGRDSMQIRSENVLSLSSEYAILKYSQLSHRGAVFDVGRDCCVWGEEWVDSGKWEGFLALLSLGPAIPLLQLSAAPCTSRQHRRGHCC